MQTDCAAHAALGERLTTTRSQVGCAGLCNCVQVQVRRVDQCTTKCYACKRDQGSCVISAAVVTSCRCCGGWCLPATGTLFSRRQCWQPIQPPATCKSHSNKERRRADRRPASAMALQHSRSSRLTRQQQQQAPPLRHQISAHSLLWTTASCRASTTRPSWLGCPLQVRTRGCIHHRKLVIRELLLQRECTGYRYVSQNERLHAGLHACIVGCSTQR
jgi:hypothetical protein